MPESYQITDAEELRCQQTAHCECLELAVGETKTCERCGDTVTRILNPDPKEVPPIRI